MSDKVAKQVLGLALGVSGIGMMSETDKDMIQTCFSGNGISDEGSIETNEILDAFGIHDTDDNTSSDITDEVIELIRSVPEFVPGEGKVICDSISYVAKPKPPPKVGDKFAKRKAKARRVNKNSRKERAKQRRRSRK